MSRHEIFAEGQVLEVGDEVEEILDNHVFTEDEDPSDRDDKFIVTLKLAFQNKGDIEALREVVERQPLFALTVEL